MVPHPDRIEIPPPVLNILEELERAGYETWCVGGAIRDALLGNPQVDVDLATAAPPAEVRRIFRRTVPVGLEHGTVGVLDEFGELHEVTTFRRDVQTDGRHAVVEFGASLDEDLARRDFTINAIAWHPVRHEWRDPFQGLVDLEHGIVRAVGDPAARFREDRLRILRALRFAARFDFAIDQATWNAAVAQVRDTAHLSAERVREEWWKSIDSARDPVEVIRLWQDSGVADTWFSDGEAQSSLVVASVAPLRDPVLLLAAWRRPVEPVLRRLKASGNDIARGRAIDRGPAAPESASPIAVRRWMANVGSAADDLATLAAANPASSAWIAELAAIRARGEATSRAQLQVSGDDLVAAGLVSPGPALGKMLATLLEAVLEDPTRNRRDTLLDVARSATP
jgi:tRNA nucleotidyltransferase (CCA-adding enzyme)